VGWVFVLFRGWGRATDLLAVGFKIFIIMVYLKLEQSYGFRGPIYWYLGPPGSKCKANCDALYSYSYSTDNVFPI